MRRHKAVSATVALLAAGAVWLFGGPAAYANPPALDIKPVVADTLVQGKWQPLLVTVQNDDSGEAVQGEIQIALEDLRRQERLATYTAPVTLPRGAATVRVPVTVYIPQNTLPDVSVFVVNGRGGSGSVVTRRRFDKIPTLPFGLTLLAVSGTPDALQTLNGERFGVLAGTSGGLRKAAATPPRGQRPYQGRNAAEMAVRVANRPDASVLPARSAGYEPVSMVYLGRDVQPDTFSDAQVNALRGWVSGGGLLIAASPKLRTDERFRTWLPVAGATDPEPFGRGSIAAPAFDPAETGFANGPNAKAYWQKTVQAGVSTRNVAPLLSAYGNYSRSYFWNSLFRAPGLQAPGASGIAVFLCAYLVLLVPVTYVVLRKLDKREWMWATAPVLVIVFSLGAYGFGYATKGTQLFQNVATVSELQNGSGAATTCAGIALFSPRRTRYNVQVNLPDAVLWSPSQEDNYSSYERGNDYGPLVVSETTGAAGSGASARDSEISMWAMRSWGFRTSQITLGSGIDARLTKGADGQITGTITNRTGKPLTRVWVGYADRGQNLQTLKIGETRPVSFGPTKKLTPAEEARRRSNRNRYGNANGTGATMALFDSAQTSNPYDYYASNTNTQDNPNPSPEKRLEAFRNAAAGGILAAYQDSVSNTPNGGATIPTEAFVTAFNGDTLAPVTIDGQTIPSGMTVNILIVHVPLGK